MIEGTAKDVMNESVFSVPSDWTLHRLARFLTEKDISGAPVVEDGELVGVVSRSDIAWYESVSQEESADDTGPGGRSPVFYRSGSDEPVPQELVDQLIQGRSDEDVMVSDIMNPTIYQVDEDAPLQEVGRMMVDYHLHRIFVTRKGELVGLIAALDLIGHVLEE